MASRAETPHAPLPSNAESPLPHGETLIRRFEDTTLPIEQWWHETHLRVAFHYLTFHDLDGAIDHMRAGIQRYNAAHDVPEAIDRGYHETITQAWLRLLHAIMKSHGPFEDAGALFALHPYLRHSKLLRLFYTRDRILSEKAKHTWVEPDVCAIGSYPR